MQRKRGEHGCVRSALSVLDLGRRIVLPGEFNRNNPKEHDLLRAAIILAELLLIAQEPQRKSK